MQTMTAIDPTTARRTHRPAWRRLLSNWPAAVSLAVLVVITLAAVFGSAISPYDPERMNLAASKLNPSLQHPLGTDRLGRDVLTRVVVGGRVSLIVAVSAVVISTVIGTVLGLLAGYFGGWVDSVISRITEIFMSFPNFVLLVLLSAMLGPGIWNVTMIIGLFSWMMITRLVRGQTMQIRNQQYIEASVAIGLSPQQILLRHILPNLVAPIMVAATLAIAGAMLSEAALSFLGLGIQPPTASWGNMLTSAQSLQVLVNEPWAWLGPGLAITVTVLSVNYLGDGLRDTFDPRAKN